MRRRYALPPLTEPEVLLTICNVKRESIVKSFRWCRFVTIIIFTMILEFADTKMQCINSRFHCPVLRNGMRMPTMQERKEYDQNFVNTDPNELCELASVCRNATHVWNSVCSLLVFRLLISDHIHTHPYIVTHTCVGDSHRQASYYLDIKPLIDLTCHAIAKLIKGKTVRCIEFLVHECNVNKNDIKRFSLPVHCRPSNIARFYSCRQG